MNPLKALQDYGQSVWLDYIRRSLITSGELQRLVDGDGLRGITSNPAIFEKAITGSTDYADDLKALKGRKGIDPKSLYESLAIPDIQAAADVLWPVYEKTNGRDGFVSLEVSPHLARDTQATIDEAGRLWRAGARVNVTLLFSQQAYERVVEAYIAGLEARAVRGGDLSRVASVTLILMPSPMSC